MLNPSVLKIVKPNLPALMVVFDCLFQMPSGCHLIYRLGPKLKLLTSLTPTKQASITSKRIIIPPILIRTIGIIKLNRLLIIKPISTNRSVTTTCLANLEVNCSIAISSYLTTSFVPLGNCCSHLASGLETSIVFGK